MYSSNDDLMWYRPACGKSSRYTCSRVKTLIQYTRGQREPWTADRALPLAKNMLATQKTSAKTRLLVHDIYNDDSPCACLSCLSKVDSQVEVVSILT